MSILGVRPRTKGGLRLKPPGEADGGCRVWQGRHLLPLVQRSKLLHLREPGTREGKFWGKLLKLLIGWESESAEIVFLGQKKEMIHGTGKGKCWDYFSGRERECSVTIKSYLIFVIFFTRAKFLENKIYTEKHVNYDKIHRKLPIFCVITAKYTVNCQFFALNL